MGLPTMHWLWMAIVEAKKLLISPAGVLVHAERYAEGPDPLPPLSEQQEIVRRVEKLFAFTDQIESRLKQAQSHVDRITQSPPLKAVTMKPRLSCSLVFRRSKTPQQSA